LWRGSDIRFDEFELVAGEIKDGWTVLCGFVYCGVKRFFGMEEVCKKRNTSKCSMWFWEEEVPKIKRTLAGVSMTHL
jgi:hypothetical protein